MTTIASVYAKLAKTTVRTVGLHQKVKGARPSRNYPSRKGHQLMDRPTRCVEQEEGLARHPPLLEISP